MGLIIVCLSFLSQCIIKKNPLFKMFGKYSTWQGFAHPLCWNNCATSHQIICANNQRSSLLRWESMYGWGIITIIPLLDLKYDVYNHTFTRKCCLKKINSSGVNDNTSFFGQDDKT